jgi:hypothetical protein
MELLILLIVAGVTGYFIGNWRRKKKSSPPASQDVVEATAKDVVEAEK